MFSGVRRHYATVGRHLGSETFGADCIFRSRYIREF